MGHKLNTKKGIVFYTRLEENYEPQSRVNEVSAQVSAIIIYFYLASNSLMDQYFVCILENGIKQMPNAIFAQQGVIIFST